MIKQIILLVSFTLLIGCHEKKEESAKPVYTPSPAAEAAPAEYSHEYSSPNKTYSTSGYSSYRGEGHQAGYDWAEDNNIYDTSDCDGNSNSFNEGCEEYVNEQEEQSRENEE